MVISISVYQTKDDSYFSYLLIALINSTMIVSVIIVVNLVDTTMPRPSKFMIRALRQRYAGVSLVSDSGTAVVGFDYNCSPKTDHRLCDVDCSDGGERADVHDFRNRNHNSRSRRSRRQESDSAASISVENIRRCRRVPSSCGKI